MKFLCQNFIYLVLILLIWCYFQNNNKSIYRIKTYLVFYKNIYINICAIFYEIKYIKLYYEIKDIYLKLYKIIYLIINIKK